MLRADGRRAVSLTSAQYNDLLGEFAQAMQPVNRRMTWGFSLAIPVIIATLAVDARIGVGEIIDDLEMPYVSLVAGVALLTWWPMLVLYRHWRGVRQINSMIDSRLAKFPSAPAPSLRSPAFNVVEIVALFLVGPGLVIDAFGTLFPHNFDNTPFSGRGLGVLSVAGIVILLVIVGRRLRSVKLARPSTADTPIAPMNPARRSEVVARARGQSLDE